MNRTVEHNKQNMTGNCWKNLLCTIIRLFEKATLLMQYDELASVNITVTIYIKHQISQIYRTYNDYILTILKSSL